MPSFSIYQGEAGLRSENHRIKMENAKLKAENDRLRALVGEPALAELAAAELQASRLAPAAQSFSTGECQVTIGAPAKAPVMNPVIARARGIKPAAVAVVPLDLPVSTQPNTAEALEAEQASTRFQLIELHK